MGSPQLGVEEGEAREGGWPCTLTSLAPGSSSPGKRHRPPRRRRQAGLRTRVARGAQPRRGRLQPAQPSGGPAPSRPAARAPSSAHTSRPLPTPPLRPPRRPRPHRRRARTAWDGEARLGRPASRGSGTDASGLPGTAPREVGRGAAVVEGQPERQRPRATQVPHRAPLSSPHASPSSRLVACCLPTAALPDESFRSALAERKPSPPRLGAE